MSSNSPHKVSKTEFRESVDLANNILAQDAWSKEPQSRTLRHRRGLCKSGKMRTDETKDPGPDTQ